MYTEGGLGERGWAWVPVVISRAGLPVSLTGDGQIAASLPLACDACLPTNSCSPRGSLSHAHAQIPCACACLHLAAHTSYINFV